MEGYDPPMPPDYVDPPFFCNNSSLKKVKILQPDDKFPDSGPFHSGKPGYGSCNHVIFLSFSPSPLLGLVIDDCPGIFSWSSLVLAANNIDCRHTDPTAVPDDWRAMSLGLAVGRHCLWTWLAGDDGEGCGLDCSLPLIGYNVGLDPGCLMDFPSLPRRQPT